MKCRQFAPYLSAAADELEPATAGALADHLVGCRACGAEALRYARIRETLAAAAEREPEPPVHLVSSVLDVTTRRRTVHLLPVPPLDLARVLSENREALARAAGVALVTAGAAWALWRGLRGSQRTQPAGS